MERRIEAGGILTRIAEAGPQDGPAIVLLPPGLYGMGTLGGLICPTLRLWDTVMHALGAAGCRVVALDTPGQGGTGFGGGPPAFDTALQHLAAVLDVLALSRVHLVGHDEGGLLAVRLAFAAPARVASCTVVSSPAVSPTGDGLSPMTLANPLEPRLSAQGQRWAFERISYAPHHVTPELIEEAVAVGGTESAAAVGQAVATSRLAATIGRAKGDTFADLREKGFPVPAALIWGRDDPVSGPAHARALFELVAPRQPIAQLHLVNRAGYFPYREQPRLFAGLVGGFVRAVEA